MSKNRDFDTFKTLSKTSKNHSGPGGFLAGPGENPIQPCLFGSSLPPLSHSPGQIRSENRSKTSQDPKKHLQNPYRTLKPPNEKVWKSVKKWEKVVSAPTKLVIFVKKRWWEKNSLIFSRKKWKSDEKWRKKSKKHEKWENRDFVIFLKMARKRRVQMHRKLAFDKTAKCKK